MRHSTDNRSSSPKHTRRSSHATAFFTAAICTAILTVTAPSADATETHLASPSATSNSTKSAMPSTHGSGNADSTNTTSGQPLPSSPQNSTSPNQPALGTQPESTLTAGGSKPTDGTGKDSTTDHNDKTDATLGSDDPIDADSDASTKIGHADNDSNGTTDPSPAPHAQDDDQPAFTADNTSGPDQGGTRINLTPHISGTITQLATGAIHSIALTANNRLYTWGGNNYGQLGNGTSGSANQTTPTPISIPSNPTIKSIAAGFYHSLALTDTGHIYAWGSNSHGELGNGTTSNSTRPTDITPAGLTFKAVSAKGYMSMALTNDGTLYTWGDNDYGQLGNGTTSLAVQSRPKAVAIPGKQTIKSIAAGFYHNLALTDTGNVLTWGDNTYGQLGNGTVHGNNSPKPITIPGNPSIKSIAAGNYHNLLLTSTGRIYAWGYNTIGQVGNGTTANQNSPVEVTIPGAATVTDIAAGGNHSMARTKDGTLYAWGYNTSGQLGIGTNDNSSVPQRVQRSLSVTGIMAGGNMHTLALATNGELYAWGSNGYGQLGTSNTTNSNVPLRINSINAKVTSVTFDTTAGIDLGFHEADGHWIVHSPKHPAGTVSMTVNWTNADVPQPAVTIPYTYTFTPSYTVTFNTAGGSAPPASQQVLKGSTPTWPSTTPTKENALFNGWTLDGTTPYDFNKPVTGNITITAMWGAFSADPTRGPASGGTRVGITPPHNSKFLQISSSGYYSLVRSTTGKTYGWGLNHLGQLGNGKVDSNGSILPTPTKTPAGTTFTKLAAGACSATAKASDGNLYSWGYAEGGITGISGASGNLSTPSKVTTPAGVHFNTVSISDPTYCNNEYSLAISSDGATWAWGNNNNQASRSDEAGGVGTLGDGTTINRSAPVRVVQPSGVRFTQVSAGGNFALGLGDDGLIYSWGSNTNGQLGNGQYTGTALIPTKVNTPSGMTFTSISAGYNDAFAIASDGTVWAWGKNSGTTTASGNTFSSNGALGDGTTVDQPTPVRVQAGGASFTTVKANRGFALARSADGTLYSWGSNNQYGQLGNGTTRPNSTPTAVDDSLGQPVKAVDIDINDCASYYIDDEGTTHAFGYNGNGQLGNGTTDSSSTPVTVSLPLVTVTAVTFGTGSTAKPGVGLAWNNAKQVWQVTTPAYHGGTTDMTISWSNGDAQPPIIQQFTYAAPPLSRLPITGASTTALGLAIAGAAIALAFLGLALWLHRRLLH